MRTDPSSSVGAVKLPMETARTEGPATCRRSAGACNATRSISTDSAGVNVPSMLATSGMRRITPFAGSLTDTSP